MSSPGGGRAPAHPAAAVAAGGGASDWASVGDWLQRTCEDVVDALGCPVAWIGVKARDGVVRVRAAAGERASYVHEIVVRWDQSTTGRGPTGAAIRTGRAQLADLTVDPHLEPWRAAALRHRLGAVLVEPLVSEGAVLGVLGVHGPSLTWFDDVRARCRPLVERAVDCLLAEEAGDSARLGGGLFASMPAGVMVVDPQGTVAWVNAAHAELTGRDPGDVVGRRAEFLDPRHTPPALVARIRDRIDRGEAWMGERRIRRADGSGQHVVESIVPSRDALGEVAELVVTQVASAGPRPGAIDRDRRARFDALTGLPTRQALDARLRATLRGAGPGRPAALLLLDLDHFNLVNESLGHAMGDRVLLDVAEIIEEALGPDDLLVRWGGDEFAVLLARASSAEARTAGETIQRRILEYRVPLEARDLTLNAAVGVAAVDGSLGAQEVLSLADSALYQARDLGPGRIVVLGADDRRCRTRSLEEGLCATRIRDALRSGRMTLHFQPVVDLETGIVEHHEVLIRMLDEDGELVQPSMFVPVAERFGLIQEVDDWVAERVLDFLAEDPRRHLFVNVSGTSFESGSYMRRIGDAFRSGRIRPGQLVLEVTETAAVRDFDGARRWIRELTDVGCGFALDDFGTGYCTFSYLRDLPVGYVKIDRSLIQHVGFEEECAAMVGAIVGVARSLGKKVIAEGVESPETIDHLRRAGVHYGQGFYWGRPKWDAEAPITGARTPVA